MNKIAILYGSTNGNTEDVAGKIQAALNADVFNVADISPNDIQSYPYLILGASTWGAGDLQDDWDDFLPKFAGSDIAGKKVALFGLGDSSSFSDTFIDGVGTIYNAIKDKVTVVGSVATDDYNYDDSTAVIDGKFVGLPLDEDNESDKTDARISVWVEELKKHFV